MAKYHDKLKQQHFTIVSGSTWAGEQSVMVARLRLLGVSYKQYLESPRWADLVAAHRGPKCEVCGSRGALALHHVTYARLGAERPEDFCTVCTPCHRMIHEAVAASTVSMDPRRWDKAAVDRPRRKKRRR